MTDMEKKVMIRLCAKIVVDTDLYETDKEVQNLKGQKYKIEKSLER